MLPDALTLVLGCITLLLCYTGYRFLVGNVEQAPEARHDGAVAAEPNVQEPTTPEPTTSDTGLADGQRVEIHGLVAKPELNGRAARVLHFDEPSQRYAVELELLPAEGEGATSWIVRPKMKVKRANLTVLEEPDFVVETEDDDVSDRCYLCLRVMLPLTWRGDEQSRMVCCGNSICKACHVETQRQRDEALRLSDRAKSIRETDPNWRVTLGGMKDQLEEMVRTLERDGTCDLCKGRRPATAEDSFAACMRHAQAGKPWACYVLANKYESGTGVRQDLAEAHRWFEKAATHPEPAVSAFSGLGNSHLKRGNYAEARRWLEKAAAQGHAPAMYNLGKIYDDGMGVSRSAPTAVEWYERGASAGYHMAQCELGTAYLHGDGVAKSLETAHTWLLAAAQQGNATAQNNIVACIMMMNQDKPMAQEAAFFEAKLWATKAAAQGEQNAKRTLLQMESHPLSQKARG